MRKPFFRFLKLGLVCLVLPMTLKAQEAPEDREEDHSSYIGVKLGVAWPGKYFNNDQDIYSPHCLSGLALGLEGVWLAHRNIGLTASIEQLNLKRRDIDGFSVPGYVAGQTNSQWNSYLLLGGLYLSKPFFYWELEARIKTGIGNTAAFEKVYERQSGSYQQRIQYSGLSNWHQVGICARIDKKPGWNVSFNYDLSFSNPDWKIREIYGGTLSGEVISYRPSVVTISVLSITVLYSIPHYVKQKSRS